MTRKLLIAGISIFALGVFFQPASVQAQAGVWYCEQDQGTIRPCSRIPGTLDAANAQSACEQQCTDAGLLIGKCSALPACPRGAAVQPAASGGAAAGTTATTTPPATAIITRLDNPLSTNSIQELIGSILGKAFGIIGTLAVVAFIYGGFLWLTAAGNEEKIKKGGQVMVYATIGIVVIFSSYAILNTLLQGLTKGSFLQDTAASPRGGAQLPVAKPSSCSAVEHQGFGCRPIDACGVIINDHRDKSVGEKRRICDASNSTCFTGICPGDSSVVCCL